MLKTTNTLNCKFMDNLGKNRGMNIDNPRTDLALQDIEAFMNYTIETNLLMPNIEEPDQHLAIIGGATLTTKVVETLEF